MTAIDRLRFLGYSLNVRSDGRITYEYHGTTPPLEAIALLAEIKRRKAEAIAYISDWNATIPTDAIMLRTAPDAPDPQAPIRASSMAATNAPVNTTRCPRCSRPFDENSFWARRRPDHLRGRGLCNQCGYQTTTGAGRAEAEHLAGDLARKAQVRAQLLAQVPGAIARTKRRKILAQDNNAQLDMLFVEKGSDGLTEDSTPGQPIASDAGAEAARFDTEFLDLSDNDAEPGVHP